MRNKRKNYFVKKGFQAKLTLIILLVTIIVANLVGGLIYGILTGNEISRWLADLFGTRSADLLLPVIILSEFISVVIVAFIGLYVSHTMAGPVYRFERVLRSMSEGELDCSFQLRTHDEFHEIEDGLNRLIGVMNDHMKAVKKTSARLVDECASKADPKTIEASVNEMAKTLEYFKIVESTVEPPPEDENE